MTRRSRGSSQKTSDACGAAPRGAGGDDRVRAERAAELRVGGPAALHVSVHAARDPAGALRERLHALAAQRRRFGYRRLTVLLRREGLRVNHKRVDRLYRAAGLAVRRRKRKRCARVVPAPLLPATRIHQRWAMDFMKDQLTTGRGFRVFNLIDEFSRKALASEIDTSLPGARAVQALERVADTRGTPCGSLFRPLLPAPWATLT